ncbi:MAG TPA: 16S rRNA (guanine(966)-N(2))-methyltransferase RsmD [Caldisericia bacterium]|nr:16S rRNA (guanine(966)-N(2))-methyltransferase RsmD [Caldisericia bacterium]HPO29230.1 16S rRNA (guanine(966)-N(2))-methyltransferase RsmD [Caldisericia bacterium]
MQITSGGSRGKKLSFSESLHIRPTSDKVRSAIFNIVRLNIKGSKFLDLFAGTGAVGIQALSEGAEFSYFVEENWKCVNIIRKNIKELDFTEKAKIVKEKVEKFLSDSNGKDILKNFDFIFLDPPYNLTDNEYEFIIQKLSFYIGRGTTVIVEHSSKRLSSDFFLQFGFSDYKFKKYGDTALSILYK